MDVPENENFTNLFSGLSTYFFGNVQQPGLKWNLLSAYAVFILLVLILIKYATKQKSKPGCISYADTLPNHRWIPFVSLPLLDGLITWYKFRKEGVRISEMVAVKLGPDFTVSLGIKMAIVVSDPSTIQKILGSTNLAHTNKPQFLYANLVTRLLKDGLGASKVDTCEAKALVQSACSAAEKADSYGISNHAMSQFIDHHVERIVTQIIMGTVTFDFCEEQRIFFHENYKKSKKLAVERFHRPELMIPPIWWLHPNRKQLERAIDNQIKLWNQITESYRVKISMKEGKNNSTNPPSQDKDEELGIKPFQCLVELMIKGGLSNKEISDEMSTFLFVDKSLSPTLLTIGHDTVKMSMEMLVFHLAGNQQHQVDKLFESKSDNDFDLEDFSKLKYLEMCILESMRLTPTGPFFAREPQDPVEFDDNTVIPTGQLVLLCPWALHRNPEIYPNPENFDPNRFLPHNVKQRHPYAFIPFSMGKRNCIGWKVALLEMKAITAWILRHFEMHTTDDLKDVRFFFYVTVKPERPLNVTFKKRVD